MADLRNTPDSFRNTPDSFRSISPQSNHQYDIATSTSGLVPDSPDVIQTDARHRRKIHNEPDIERSGSVAVSIENDAASGGFENGCVMVTPENVIEAHRMVNNYKFGFKKWKSHVTSRPLSERSEIVKDLYADINKVKPVKVSTLRPSNLVYVLLFGWWLALLYLIVGVLMGISIVGRKYVPFCWRMAQYFIWPFGKFVYLIHQSPPTTIECQYRQTQADIITESTTLIPPPKEERSNCSTFWKRPDSYFWLVLGVPVLLVVHFVIMFLSWLFVVTIPISKLNQKAILQVMWMPPDRVLVGDSSFLSMDPKRVHSEIIMYTHQSFNIYYYKYTIDGMNIILVNLLVFVVLSLAIGYSDPHNKYTSGVTKCILAVFAIIPLTYYIGMAIISISAQSSFAIGAVLNATFGSLVELILYIVVMLKGVEQTSSCYVEIVKSGLTGTLIGSILFIPGICMIVGGLKYRSQNFNSKSASVTALLLFVSIGGVFAPTLFSKIFGDLTCDQCEINTTTHTSFSNITSQLHCKGCQQTIMGMDGDKSLFEKHIQPLVYACAILLPIAYVIGVVFTLKTHTSYVYDEFYEKMSEDNAGEGHGHGGAPQWSRLKSVLTLLFSAVLIALCAELITDNIQELLSASGISEYFIGVTMIAMIPELPEIVNGVQFALQNNVNLGIEIGTNTAIQVCLIQVPVIVLINAIHPALDFYLIFNDVHMWAAIFSVIVINYIFQDGKTDYFQGAVLVAIYLILLCMYFFVPTPNSAKCGM